MRRTERRVSDGGCDLRCIESSNAWPFFVIDGGLTMGMALCVAGLSV
eukprot:COSAG02_NODE_207_length_29119_cov_41.071365_14_plen_47_part_00